MKRSGFKSHGVTRHAPSERSRPIYTVEPGAWKQISSLPSQVTPSIDKHEYIRSKEVREAFRLIPCQHCGADDGTVCCAHSNWSIHGKGGGIKADDSRGASLCSRCHVPLLDQGATLSKSERQSMWWDAHQKSIRLLVSLGYWPAGVPVPDVSINPWTGSNNHG